MEQEGLQLDDRMFDGIENESLGARTERLRRLREAINEKRRFSKEEIEKRKEKIRGNK